MSIPPEDNHFKCYDVAGPPASVAVTLDDQFVNEFVIVSEPRYLCNPVAKTVDAQTFPILHPADHLLCYSISPISHAFAPNAIDQFEPIEPGYFHQIIRNEMICVPSTKVIAPMVPAVGASGLVSLVGLLGVSGLALGLERLTRGERG